LYTEAIKRGLQDEKLLISLYNNKALCNFKLKNFGKTIEDCEKVLKIDKNNLKALYRISLALEKLNRFKEALTFCQKGLHMFPHNKNFSSLSFKLFAGHLKEEEEKIKESKRKKKRNTEIFKI
jgi:tetratricopeptide (TPR) repeat protein